MKKRFFALFLILTLCVSLFSGCTLAGVVGLTGLLLNQLPQATEPTSVATEPTEPAETTAPPTTEPVDPSGLPPRYPSLGARDYAPADETVAMVRFSDMPYERPDTDALIVSLDELTQLVKSGASADAILAAYYPVSDAYLHFYTMDSLAYIRYTLDTNDSYYKEEYDALELIGPDVEEKLEAFYKACAESPNREALEREYFEYGFFDDYEDFSRYTNPEYLALAKEEEKLMSEYRTALEDPQVEFHGQTQSFYELLAEYDEIETYQQYMDYLELLQAYYEQYNQKVGDIFLKIVKVRKQIAEVMGYESYADYSYDLVYERDYTHEQGVEFCEQIQKWIVPIYKQLNRQGDYGEHFPIDETAMVAGLQSAVQNMGGQIEEAYRFMQAYELCDLTASDAKFDSSYTTYLHDYDAPFLTVNADGTSRDYLTFSHEFGHFTDDYVTYSRSEDLETAETFSQAMEFLSLCYTEGVFSEQQREMLLKLNLRDMLDTFSYQAALAQFEDGVYALSEDELSVESINGIYRQCCKDYGLYSSNADFFYRYGWIDVTHLFEAPYYVISYCVSADTALQVYMREAEETGAGLAAYWKLLEREENAGVQAVMESAGLDNPFRAGAIEELAGFYKEAFQLK